MSTNELRGMLCQIIEKTEVKNDKCKIMNHSARKSAIIILKAADVPEDEIIYFSTVNNNIEEFYSYLGNLYTHDSESEDNNNVDGTKNVKHVNEIGYEDNFF
ncbi:28744_t:CDS:2 [Gigaspora margarita]|uniref:28744_t:CDS:1 n=1 Tax=Gigaspora margarita TaxID=4874 RepID=A0ABN7VYI2_GIGMA|nr:28744_t:CDS:2 [Gigaspora margarita]